MSPAAYWSRLPDGTYRVETLPLPPISAAAYAALPERFRALPTDPREFQRWKAAHYIEFAARVAGGPWAETYALRQMKSGIPAAEAITAARRLAPAGRPAIFPTIVQALQQAGRAAEAAWVQTGLSPQAQASASGTTPVGAILAALVGLALVA